MSQEAGERELKDEMCLSSIFTAMQNSALFLFSSLSSIPFVLKFDFLGYNNRKQFGERTAFADKKETIMKMPFLKVQFSYRNEKLRFLLGHQKS